MKIISVLTVVSLAISSVWGSAQIISSTQNGTFNDVTVSVEYQMGEDTSLTKARDAAIAQAKALAIETSGTHIITENRVEYVSDAALSRSKTSIMAFSDGRVAARLISEDKVKDLIYKGTFIVSVDMKSLEDELQRQAKIVDIDQKLSKLNKPVIQVTNDVNATDFDKMAKSIKSREDQINERVGYLNQFRSALISSSYLSCQVSEMIEDGKEHILAKYQCSYAPPKDAIGNYLEYYKADICTSSFLERESEREGFLSKVGRWTATGLGYAAYGVGMTVVGIVYWPVTILKVTDKLTGWSKGPQVNELWVKNIETTTEKTETCSMDWLNDKEVEIQLEWKGQPLMKTSIVNGGETVSNLSFTLYHRMKLPKDQVFDVRPQLAITRVPIQTKK